MSKKAVFYNEWLKDPIFMSWVQRHPSDTHIAVYVLCDGRAFELGNIGRRGLSSHSGGNKQV